MQLKSVFLRIVLPTHLLGLGTVPMKLSMREGSSTANYLVSVGVVGTVIGAGWVSQPRAIFFAASMMLSLGKYHQLNDLCHFNAQYPCFNSGAFD